VAANGVAAVEEEPGADQRLEVGATAGRDAQAEVQRDSGRSRGSRHQRAEAAEGRDAAREPPLDREGQLEDTLLVEDVVAADAEPDLRGCGERREREHGEGGESDPEAHAPPRSPPIRRRCAL